MYDTKVLFTLGIWTIRFRMFSVGPRVYAHHPCQGEAAMQKTLEFELCWMGNDAESGCLYCKLAVPDEVQALVLLAGQLEAEEEVA
jgi:hypothetical protein